MPTYEADPRFWREWAQLSEAQQGLFRAAYQQMVEDLRAHRRFHPRLRVKGYQGQRGVFEMSWADDGRALFRYGTSLWHLAAPRRQPHQLAAHRHP